MTVEWGVNLLKGEQIRKICGNMGTYGNFGREQGLPLGDPQNTESIPQTSFKFEKRFKLIFHFPELRQLPVSE